ncbi:MAG: DUF1269 domain-containing protein [Anaerolineae bacterium]|nr:DUF1269 domain-containing protein [Anaerolineae bacterium]MCO5196904.1 DUF1269 domain-containing protein [Anaerolineae bacterium]
MSNVIIAGFAGEHTAQEVYTDLLKMKKAHDIELGNAAVVARDAAGEIHITRTDNSIWAGLGTAVVAGTLLAVSGVGLVLVGIGAVGSGMLVDKGLHPDISFDFLNEANAMLTENDTSAVVILEKKEIPQPIIDLLKERGGRILKTTLSAEAEAELKHALEESA